MSKLSLRSGRRKFQPRLQVADEAVGLVLGRHRDVADARVEGVREREVDDARLAAEIDGRLHALVGELEEPGAASACQDIGHRMAREWGGGNWHWRFLSFVSASSV